MKSKTRYLLITCRCGAVISKMKVTGEIKDGTEISKDRCAECRAKSRAANEGIDFWAPEPNSFFGRRKNRKQTPPAAV